MIRFFQAIAMVWALVFASPALSQSAQNPHYPVVMLDRDKGVFAIVGAFDFRTPLSFERVLENIPNPRVLVLDSPGGSVHSALAIASRVRAMGLKTVVNEDDGCFSACSMVFFAGASRIAYGDLGVHQISTASGNDDLVAGQFALADIIEVLGDFDVPAEVMAIMLRTPPEDMYVFSRQENIRFGFYGGAAAAPKPKPKVKKPQRGVGSNDVASRVATSPLVEPTQPSDKKKSGSQSASSNSAKGVNVYDPSTWRGKTIQGELVEDGKRWYSWLHTDGRTTFQTTSGKRLYGRYRISNGYVCYRYDGSTSEACRTPRSVNGRVGWYDTKGKYVSYIAGVKSISLSSVAGSSGLVPSVAEYIRGDECVLVVASRPNVAEARRYVFDNISDRRYLKAFKSKNGWIAITIGKLKPHEVDPTLARWKKSGKSPQDSYCSTGKKYTGGVDIGF